MPNADPDILVRRLIDGDLSDDEVGPALHRIADDAEARNLLRFELHATQDLAARRSAAPSDAFASQTMEALTDEPTPAASPSLTDQLRTWWAAATAPVSVNLRPLSAALTVLLVGLVAWMVWPTAPSSRQTESTPSSSTSTVQQASAQTSQQGETVWIRFLYTDSDADSVAVAGDFSQWEPVALSPRTVNGETVWTGLVPVSRGEHEYQFVINGEQWVTDPLAPVKRNDGFGAQNAVLKL